MSEQQLNAAEEAVTRSLAQVHKLFFDALTEQDKAAAVQLHDAIYAVADGAVKHGVGHLLPAAVSLLMMEVAKTAFAAARDKQQPRAVN